MKYLLFPLLFSAVSLWAQPVWNSPEGVNGNILAIAVQPDGKVVIGGSFNQVGEAQRQNLARLNADGTVDETFTPRPQDGVNGTVQALAIQPDGSILVGGNFNMAAENETYNLARYSVDGKIDRSINTTNAPRGSVAAIVALPDGSFVVGGSFNQAGDKVCRGLAKYGPDLTVSDAGLGQEGVNGTVLALGANDKQVVLGGSFTVPTTGTKNLAAVAK